MVKPQKTSQKNLAALAKNPYPGRGIIVGLDAAGENLVQVYWIMGRSAHSRNRVFTNDAGRVFTEPADPSRAGDTSLIIYNAMNEREGEFVVSNGAQTDTVVESLSKGGSFRWAMQTWQYEPDVPNYTPRIAALASIRGRVPLVQMAILRKDAVGEECERCFYDFSRDEITHGQGYCLTTYSGDGGPLPAFRDVPYVLPLEGYIQDVAATFWNALNVDNRVSLAVKFISLASGDSTVEIVNKFSKA